MYNAQVAMKICSFFRVSRSLTTPNHFLGIEGVLSTPPFKDGSDETVIYPFGCVLGCLVQKERSVELKNWSFSPIGLAQLRALMAEMTSLLRRAVVIRMLRWLVCMRLGTSPGTIDIVMKCFTGLPKDFDHLHVP